MSSLMDEIDNQYISNAIDELTNLLGIKERIPVGTIREPLSAGKTKECAENIASYLGLPIAVNLTFSNMFESRSLAKVNSGGGSQGITAQVSIPSHLPFYGTSRLQGFPISVKISGDCQRHGEAFMATMAHELSHIVLHCLWHKEKDNEIYADLAAMILGFSEVMRGGRKITEIRQNYPSVETTTTTYGYLSDEQFNFAFGRIRQILKENTNSCNDLKQQALRKLAAYGKQLSSYQKELLEFNRFLEYLDKDRNRRIGKEDGAKIVAFHQLYYADKFVAVATSNEQKLKETSDYCAELLRDTRHYGQQRLGALRALLERVDSLISSMQRELLTLHSDVSILGRYVRPSFLEKLARAITDDPA